MDKKTLRIVSLVSQEELERIQKAAEDQDRTLSSFVRIAALSLAEKITKRRHEAAPDPEAVVA